MDTKSLYDFKKQVEALKEFRGRGTELISVYVTPGYPLSEITGKLRDEYGQAANIKSKSTQKNVQAALEKIMQYLKTFKQTPENGIAIFAGNVSETEGKVDVQLYSVVPPVPLGVQFYRCESQFVMEPLEELGEKIDTYGLVVMDGKEATVAVLRGKQIKIVKKLHSTAHQKVSKGGQSAARYSRLHTEGVEYYYKRIGEAMDAFVDVKNLKGVILGGPGPAKDDFLKQKPFNYQLKILGVVDTGYTDEFGLREVLEKSDDIIAGQEAIMERQLLQEFMTQVSKNGLVAYGYSDVKKAVSTKQASKVLVSESLFFKRFEWECNQCEKEGESFAEKSEEKQCDCGGKRIVKEEEDLVDEIIGLAEENSIPVEMISQETAEGSQFYATFRGLGVFLRYK